ncbi:uncharacterized protein HRG_01606 [Hirsutella rhossiliensis]|nr:uncharacterized protein HRG_01606 [Hirsutella rhossiliensis]KAH0966197.1 hypothetical protein HRG_01606 [Hirsutella rhossiliensis]
MPDADTSEPPLNSTGSHMTLAEKARLIKKWADNKQKHVRKKRDKNSHVYWVTSGMGDHLKSHSITKESHHGRINGYGRAIGGGDYTEVDAWSGRPRQRARLTAKESIRQWFVKHRQPFSVVENLRLLLSKRYFVERREKLKIELQYNCATISLTLDIWTAPNRVPIFAIITHWITPEFEERGVEKTLEELRLKPKLLAITGDNAANNGTLYYLKTRPHSNFRASW